VLLLRTVLQYGKQELEKSMCGICGIMQLGMPVVPADDELIGRMTDTLAHRGPNDRGIWSEGRVSLGHRRLSVIDLSSAGHQPMTNEDGSVVIVYNGEVYNFRELKQRYRLEERGHTFHSHTDTEVLVHLYEEIGLEMVSEMIGMFALAIWDGREERLHLVRDRYGIKPLFYQGDSNNFRFASEIKAIIADSRVARRPSLQALHDFLTFNYIPGTQTAFEDIHEIPPAHYATVDPRGEMRLTRYWDLDFSQVDHSISEEAAVNRAYELMDLSVRRRLIADVPVGVLLSGGLDSSTLVALMSKHVSEPVHTYSVGFEDRSFNELPYARIVADEFRTIHNEVLVTADKVRNMLHRYIGFIDEPYGDGSAIPTYFVCEMAKDEVVVVLSGEGGDEAFAGYDTYAAYHASKWFGRIPRIVRNGLISPLVKRLPVSDSKLSLEFKMKRFLGGQDLPVEQAHMWWRIVLNEAQKIDLYTSEVREQLVAQQSDRYFREAFARSAAKDDLSALMYIDSTVFLPDDLMIKNDRMSMAHSLEARVPFTDSELTGYLARVPASLKMKRMRKKHLMRRAMQRELPAAILNKKKVGLEMPYSRWLKHELRDVMAKYLGPSNLEETGLFRPGPVQELIDNHIAGRRDNGRALWGLLNYMIWHELYFE
jgi:asparagine synthase (glutamine-hydrolysing)